MRTRGVTALLLLSVLFLGTGATEGIREARDWQLAADLALANNQPLEAYRFYLQVAETYPDTPHGQYAAKRARCLHAQLMRPARSPAEETPCNWARELLDFVTWP